MQGTRTRISSPARFQSAGAGAALPALVGAGGRDGERIRCLVRAACGCAGGAASATGNRPLSEGSTPGSPLLAAAAAPRRAARWAPKRATTSCAAATAGGAAGATGGGGDGGRAVRRRRISVTSPRIPSTSSRLPSTASSSWARRRSAVRDSVMRTLSVWAWATSASLAAAWARKSERRRPAYWRSCCRIAFSNAAGFSSPSGPHSAPSCVKLPKSTSVR
mmetsp:Transcript_59961/g.125409  ORF Transcript_59961/g.125409 Transcript_59961/m.125409 type:complete len:220 (-) Transcript_59961:2508-3167(-)